MKTQETRRTSRVNSLLKEVLSDVIRKHLQSPDVHELHTITKVSVTKDLRHAKVHVSVIGSDEEKERTLAALNKAAGYLAVLASKQVVLRYFPELLFKLDLAVERFSRIESLIGEVQDERSKRAGTAENELIS